MKTRIQPLPWGSPASQPTLVCVCVALPGVTCDPRWDLCVQDTAYAWCVSRPSGLIIPTQRRDGRKRPFAFRLLRQAGFLCFLPTHHRSLLSAPRLQGNKDCFQSPLSDLPPYLQFQRPPLRPSFESVLRRVRRRRWHFFSGSTLSWLAPPLASLPAAPPPRWAPHPPSILKGGRSRESVLESPFPTGHTLLMGFDHFCSFIFICDF